MDIYSKISIYIWDIKNNLKGDKYDRCDKRGFYRKYIGEGY